RSFSYGELAVAAATLPVPTDPVVREKDFRLVGKRHKRVDGPAIVTGKAQYGIDARIGGMKFAVIARPPSFGATVKTFDATEAKKLAGVHDVVPVTTGFSHGLAVTADDTWTALKARDLLKIEWAPGEHAKFSSAEHYAKLRNALTKPGLLIREEGK